MIRRTLLALLLIPGIAEAVVCKTVDADGVVSYSEVPAAECPQPVKLPDYSRYAPRPIKPRTPTAAPAAAAATERFSGYDSIQIVQPEANGTVRSNEGNVAVSLSLQPALQQGHRIKLFLDGGAVQGEFDGTAIQLSGVDRGSHSLRAVVSDAGGKRMGESPSVRFTLRKASIYDPQRDRPGINPPPEPEHPIEPGPENPVEPAPEPKPQPTRPYDPSFQPGAQPQPGAAAPTHTPGKTNPAFKPAYGR